MKKNLQRGWVLIQRTWRWSWLLTLPVSLVFILWAINTTESFYRFVLKDGVPTAIKESLLKEGKIQASFMANDALRFLSPHSHSKEKSLDAVHLYITRENLEILDSKLPYPWDTYVKAKLLYPNGNLYNVKIKYRGDRQAHFQYRKKSIRIKTSKKRLYNGFRKFNLIVPKAIPKVNIQSYHSGIVLAGQMGILSPEIKWVELYINGKYSGLYQFVEQLDEMFLRKNSLVPGDLFSGEMIVRDAIETHEIRELFTNHNLWKKLAVNNHNPEEWDKNLEEFTRRIYTNDMDGMLEMIDLEAWARFAAFITLEGNTLIDTVHNWKLYFDPARGKFIPIIWDTFFGVNYNIIPLLSNKMDVVLSVSMEKLHRSHRFMKAKHEAMEAFFLSGKDRDFLNFLDDDEKLLYSLKGDGYNPFLMSYGELADVMNSFKQEVLAHYNNIQNIYLKNPPRMHYSLQGEDNTIQLNIEGFTPAKFIEIDHQGFSLNNPSGVISFSRGGKTIHKSITGFMHKKGSKLRLDIPLFSKRSFGNPSVGFASILSLKDVEVEPATYFIRVNGLTGSRITGIEAGYSDGKTIKVERKEKLETYNLDGNFNVPPLAHTPDERVWRGDMYINDTREIWDNLTIRPGTTVHLADSASLIIKGKLNAVGTAEAPITFAPQKGNTGPWGSVALHGIHANGSSLKHVKFSGGSGAKHKHVEYSAMLSIHDVKDVTIDSCEFSDSRIVDDMVHAVYSTLDIKDSTFRNSFADALDLDYVTGKIENSVFLHSGNDAIDLMSSKVAVMKTIISGSKDKGISVGESASLLVFNTSLDKNTIGIQVKDGSNAIVYNSELLGNTKTIDAYKKNWQYGDGGYIKIFKSSIQAKKDALEADKKSSIRVFDSYLDAGDIPVNKRIIIDDSVDSDHTSKGKASTPSDYKDQLDMENFFRPFTDDFNPEIRGALQG